MGYREQLFKHSVHPYTDYALMARCLPHAVRWDE